MRRIPLIEDLTSGPIEPGTVLLVEFDAPSLWYNATYSIAAGWLKQEGKVDYNVYVQSPDNLRSKLTKLGLRIKELEDEDRLRIEDRYTLTLGQKSNEKHAADSLKIADLSLRFSQQVMRTPPDPSWLRLTDNSSTLARFNDDKAWTEFLLTRAYPSQKSRKSYYVQGLARGLHEEWVYRKLEAACDGVIDFRLDEEADPPKNLMRIRSLRDVGCDGRWHTLKMSDSLEVMLE